MNFTLQTLSPVHIGSGNVLEPFEYILEGGWFYRVDVDKTFALIYEKHKDFTRQFELWLKKSQETLERENDNAKQALLREKFNIAEFCRTQLRDFDIADKIKEEGCIYKLPAPYGLQKRKQIGELIRNGRGEIYIPGSSIKGAIRTALLWRAFYSSSAQEKNTLLMKVRTVMEEKMARAQRELRRFGELDKVFTEKYFHCGEKTRDRVSYRSIHYDLMKFITVSDAVIIHSDEESAVLPVNLYLKNKPVQTQTNAYEIVAPNIRFNFKILFDKAKLSEVYRKKGDTWVELEKKFSGLFGVELKSINDSGFEDKVIESILSALSDFSAAVIKKEFDWLSRYMEKGKDKKGNTFINPSMKPVNDFYASIKSSPSPLIRFGWGSGFLATTIYDAVAGSPEIAATWKQIATYLKLGATPKMKREELAKYEYVTGMVFPGSKRMAAQFNEAPIAPLGWATLLPAGASGIKALSIEFKPGAGSAASAAPQPAAITKEDVIKRNSARKLKIGDIIEAEVLSVEPKQVKVKVLLPGSNPELIFKYGNTAVINDEKYVTVKISNIVKGVIAAVAFNGLIKERITE